MRCVLIGLLSMAISGCGKSEKSSPDRVSAPESFHFMEIGVNTVVDAAVRDRLRAALGSDGINRSATIDLELKYKGFLKEYYPDLAGLNKRLNVSDVVRKEYPATKLTYRNTKQMDTFFDYVELVYANESGYPLVIKMIAKKEIPELMNTVKEKYGPPERTPIDNGRSYSLSWLKNKDVFVIARILGRYGQPEYYMMIVFVNRLNRFLSATESGEKQSGEAVDKVF